MSARRAPFPERIKPMLATLVDEPFDRKGWLFEVKWDGYRAIADVRQKRPRLYSRRGLPLGAKYPPVQAALAALERRCVIDGEIIALKEGKPDFHTLQQWNKTRAPLQYAVFDLLYLDGVDMRKRPLLERKALLRDLIPRKEELLLYSEHVETRGKRFFERIRSERLEGIVAKECVSPYRDGVRSKEWLKIKTVHEQEAIIIGWTEPRGSRAFFGALVLAAYDGDTLRYIGHSGGNFSEAELKGLSEKLTRIETKISPVKERVPVNARIHWVRPRYVCQIRFTEWTPEGRMRHPIFQGLREDKKAKEVLIERPKHERTRTGKSAEKKADTAEITNPDKVFWPDEGYTKGDVIAYYDALAPLLLPHLEGRPQNLHRHPNGIRGKSFYQKRMPEGAPPFVGRADIWSESNGETIPYLVCDNAETLRYLANLGCIELNPWASRIDSLEYPDYMIFDLDPGDNTFEELILVARELHAVLESAGVDHTPKTSGKTGMHIAVPLGGRYHYDTVRPFAEMIMRLVHARYPKLTSLERSPSKRRKKIYLDYLQNRRGQTICAPYSLRPVPGAPVSMPLEWKEVRKGLTPGAFTIRNAPARIKRRGDLWRQTLSKGADLSRAIRRIEKSED